MNQQINNIEVLKRTLLALEAETQQTRKKLQQLLLDKENLSCRAEVKLNALSQNYITSFYSKNNALLYSFVTKKYSRALATTGIQSAQGLRPRVSWKDVDAGKVWTSEVVIYDWYWQKNFCKEKTNLAQVIHLSTFRDALKV